jgi:hypothetical protein
MPRMNAFPVSVPVINTLPALGLHLQRVCSRSARPQRRHTPARPPAHTRCPERSQSFAFERARSSSVWESGAVGARRTSEGAAGTGGASRGAAHRRSTGEGPAPAQAPHWGRRHRQRGGGGRGARRRLRRSRERAGSTVDSRLPDSLRVRVQAGVSRPPQLLRGRGRGSGGELPIRRDEAAPAVQGVDWSAEAWVGLAGSTLPDPAAARTQRHQRSYREPGHRRRRMAQHDLPFGLAA